MASTTNATGGGHLNTIAQFFTVTRKP
jgi:hypothetical protein